MSLNKLSEIDIADEQNSSVQSTKSHLYTKTRKYKKELAKMSASSHLSTKMLCKMVKDPDYVK